MSKTPTISLPFTSYDIEPSNQKWYNVFSGSRLRNRILAIFSFLTIFITGAILLRNAIYGSSSPSLGAIQQSTQPLLATLQNYDGVDVKSPSIDNLIIVAGHAIWLGGLQYGNDSDWYLEPHQHGNTGAMVEHIKKGAHLAKQESNSLLIFSGGNTRPFAGARTESQSYEALLDLLTTEDPSLKVDHVTTEEFARDSYENLIFSIARFFEVVGRYPKTISVVGYSFKEQRYRSLHRKAVKFPEQAFSYYGIDPPTLDEAGLEGEYNNAISHFEEDLYGCHDANLLAKKKGRNPFRRRHGYEITNPEMASLLAYCPAQGASVYPGKLPWT